MTKAIQILSKNLTGKENILIKETDSQTIKILDSYLFSQNIKKVNFRKQRARSDNTVGVTFARLGNYSMAIDYFKKAVSNDDEELDYKADK